MRAILSVVIVALAVSLPSAQSSKAFPRTADGHPDLNGVWFFGTLTPLQRPDDVAGRTHLNDEEIAAIEKRAASRPESFGLFGDKSKYAFDKRTSLVVDPPDGKVPPMTPAGQKRQDARSAAR